MKNRKLIWDSPIKKVIAEVSQFGKIFIIKPRGKKND